MKHKIQLQPAYVLHTRAFRDTSLIVDFMTRDHGKVSAVARGARTQRSKFRGLLQAFVPLIISWSGKNDLVTLTAAEPIAAPHDFSGDALISAMYLNELQVRLLAVHDPHPELFSHYQNVLQQMDQGVLSSTLRHFENLLLAELGYGFDWGHTADSGSAIEPDQWYVFIPEQGFLAAGSVTGNHLAFPGSHLLMIASGNDIDDPAIARSAKQLMRAAFAPLLGGKPIRSRELFV